MIRGKIATSNHKILDIPTTELEGNDLLEQMAKRLSSAVTEGLV